MGAKSSHMNRRRSVSFAETPKTVGYCEGPRSARSFPPQRNSRKGSSFFFFFFFFFFIYFLSDFSCPLSSFLFLYLSAEVLLEAARTGNLKILSSILDSCPHLIETRDTVPLSFSPALFVSLFPPPLFSFSLPFLREEELHFIKLLVKAIWGR